MCIYMCTKPLCMGIHEATSGFAKLLCMMASWTPRDLHHFICVHDSQSTPISVGKRLTCEYVCGYKPPGTSQSYSAWFFTKSPLYSGFANALCIGFVKALGALQRLSVLGPSKFLYVWAS